MYFAAFAISGISLLMIVYQDYRFRAVHWILFPLLALGGIGMGVAGQPVVKMLTNMGSNLAFLGLQLALLKGYFLLRRKGKEPLLDTKIGLGDILFLAAACIFFSPLNFIGFYILSLLFAIGSWFSMGGLRKTLIPLAGLQAFFLLVCLFVGWWSKYSLLDDDWLLLKIMGL